MSNELNYAGLLIVVIIGIPALNGRNTISLFYGVFFKWFEDIILTQRTSIKLVDYKQQNLLKDLAGTTGFEPAISALTGQCVKPGYTTSPKLTETHCTWKAKKSQIFVRVSKFKLLVQQLQFLWKMRRDTLDVVWKAIISTITILFKYINVKNLRTHNRLLKKYN